MLYMYGVVISPPLFVTVKVAVPVVVLLHAPATESAGGVFGVDVGVSVGSGVNVAVAVGALIHEPFTLNVTDERKDVLYVTTMVAFPAPVIEVEAPGSRSTMPFCAGSESE